jgi:hypothetical protein
MTAQSVIQSNVYSRPAASLQAAKVRVNVRMDLLVIRLMIAVGLALPALMISHVLPASFLLIGIAFGLIVVGGVMAFIRCGEVA